MIFPCFQVPSHADFHFTWRSPHPYAGEAGQLSGTAAFFTVLLVLAIMGTPTDSQIGKALQLNGYCRCAVGCGTWSKEIVGWKEAVLLMAHSAAPPLHHSDFLH
jgi:hypothetical protein